MRMFENDPAIRAEFEKLQEKFLENAARDVSEVFRILDESGDSCPTGESGSILRRISHGLRGAGGSYGFADVTSSAGELEEAYLAEASGGTLREAALTLQAAVQNARRTVAERVRS
jgi:hypothetical protein